MSNSKDQQHIEGNRQLWNEKVPYHFNSTFYDVESFRAGRNALDPITLAALGNRVQGRSLLHLQCHFGQDTLSFHRMGARTVGIDFSEAALEKARTLSRELNLDARFVLSDVLRADDVLNEQFDVVYTSFGVLGWLPDLVRWAEVVRHFLRPGGLFYIAEFHPVLYMYDWEKNALTYPYFNRGVFVEEVEGTYADTQANTKGTEAFWCHSLAEILQPLLDQGLHLIRFQEFDYSPYNCFSNLQERRPGEYVYQPEGIVLPHVFSLEMRRG